MRGKQERGGKLLRSGFSKLLLDRNTRVDELGSDDRKVKCPEPLNLKHPITIAVAVDNILLHQTTSFVPRDTCFGIHNVKRAPPIVYYCIVN